MSVIWNPWHGCHKLSAGCVNCYVYRTDGRYDRDARSVHKNADFDLPIRRARNGTYAMAPGQLVYTCFTSDFFLEDADPWRPQVWHMIDERRDCQFFIITKRIDRMRIALPRNWGDGYGHVTICCTAENQDRADYRLPIFLNMPIAHKQIICEPLLGRIDLRPYLSPVIEGVTVGGESGPAARICDYEWVLDIRRQCLDRHVPFTFKQTGANFRKDGKVYAIARKLQHSQARAAGIDCRFDDSHKMI